LRKKQGEIEMANKAKASVIVGLLGAAAGSLVILIMVRRLPDLVSRMMTRMMSQMMKSMEPGSMPDG
jgi:CheY-specific phosphatase CheX